MSEIPLAVRGINIDRILAGGTMVNGEFDGIRQEEMYSSQVFSDCIGTRAFPRLVSRKTSCSCHFDFVDPP
jgi:hypothetical protein